jgi:HEAT repeat protein
MESSLPTDRLLAGDCVAREDAARSVRETATSRPATLHGVLDVLLEALADDREAVRRDVANAVFEVGVDEPAAVAPVAERLVSGLDDESAAVRMGLARPVAELAAERPQRVRFAVEPLVTCLTDVESVRHSAAWALSSLAPRYPEVLHDHLDAFTRALLDDYPPVQKHVLRTMTHLERTYPDMLEVARRRVRELTESDVPAVRQAACRAIAANDPPWARSHLTDISREDPHPVVRQFVRSLLGIRPETATLPAGTADETLFSELPLDSWLVVATDHDHETPYLVGRLSAVCRERSDDDESEMASRGLRREDFETREAWLEAPRVRPSGDRTAVHLHNPFEEYGVNLVRVARDIGSEYTAPDRDVPTLFRPTDLRPVGPDRACLLAASPGDRLSFLLEGADHEIEVHTAGEQDGTYRIAGENAERGYEITFRPLSTDPMMAVFAEGRAFPASNLQLSDGE